jgi:hypothetical protein
MSRIFPLVRAVLVPGALVTLPLAVACSSDGGMSPTRSPIAAAEASQPAPAGLASFTAAGASHTIWPYTGVDFTGTPQDPINLIFSIPAGPRAVRAALLALNGDRSTFGLPADFPFSCTWSDAIGDLQTGYGETSGWTGSAIQLQCGSYGPIRFHVRLFDVGNGVTAGNAHFEFLIPGTADHQVLSWEVAEQLVKVDMLRSGLLDPVNPLAETGGFNAAPFREIPSQLYNLLPAELRGLAGGPLGDVSAGVPIATDGRATIFNVTGTPAAAPAVAEQAFTIQYDQTIPKAVCATGPADLVHVRGPVELRKWVRQSGPDLLSEFHSSGRLELTPMDGLTGAITGPLYAAEVRDDQATRVSDDGNAVRGSVLRLEVPPTGAARGRLSTMLQVGTTGAASYRSTADCAP